MPRLNKKCPGCQKKVWFFQEQVCKEINPDTWIVWHIDCVDDSGDEGENK